MKRNLSKFSAIAILAIATALSSCTKDGMEELQQPEEVVLKSAEATVQAPTKPSGWELVWYDDFDGTSLDMDKWKIGYPWGSRTHNHKGYAMEENVVVKDGILTLVAGGGMHGDKYYTGVVSAKTQLKFDEPGVEWQVEARLKLADKNGIWPAFWLNSTGGWPNVNEIDIMEQKGWGSQNNYETNMHFGVSKGDRPSQYITKKTGSNLDNTWHTYAVSIKKDEVVIKFDNVTVNRVTGSRKNKLREKAFNIILNSAVGGDWGGNGYKNWIDDYTQVSTYEIDYLAVYKK